MVLTFFSTVFLFLIWVTDQLLQKAFVIKYFIKIKLTFWSKQWVKQSPFLLHTHTILDFIFLWLELSNVTTHHRIMLKNKGSREMQFFYLFKAKRKCLVNY